MGDPTGAGVELRVLRLERECRRLRCALAIGAVVVLGAAAMGQGAPAPKVLQAQSFELVGLDGKVLASLGPDERMRCALKLYATGGEPQVALGASVDGGGVLAIMQDESEPACVLSAVPGKVSVLTLFAKGREHAATIIAHDKGGGVSCRSAGVDASLGILRGNAEICVGKVLESGATRPSASLTRFASGDTTLKIWDKDGTLFHDIPPGSHPEANPK
jgi:hypothetical protein